MTLAEIQPVGHYPISGAFINQTECCNETSPAEKNHFIILHIIAPNFKNKNGPQVSPYARPFCWRFVAQIYHEHTANWTMNVLQKPSHIKGNLKSSPTFGEVAANAHLSPFHFQRLFSEWAGHAQKILQHIKAWEYAKNWLRKTSTHFVLSAFETGLARVPKMTCS